MANRSTNKLQENRINSKYLSKAAVHSGGQRQYKLYVNITQLITTKHPGLTLVMDFSRTLTFKVGILVRGSG